MLYRFLECDILHSEREPPTEAWIDASTHTDAVQRVTKLLALTWDVTEDEVCVQGGHSELELEESSVEPAAAGSRRWAASGSCGDRPSYYEPAARLVFLGARPAERLSRAFASARTHASELATEVLQEAAEAQNAGNAAKAEDLTWDAASYQRFAQSGVVAWPA